MKLSHAAVLEPNAANWRRIADGLKKSGLKVSAARQLSTLADEQVVVLGPTLAQPAKVARAVRSALPRALLLAAQRRTFRAPFADAVLPLPLSPNDLRARLPELSALRRAPPAEEPGPRPGEGILDPLTSFYTFPHFKEVLFVEVKRARRYGFPLSLALVGFDPLEREVTAELRAQLMGGLALAIRRSLRDTDFPVQYSPERVVLLMPHTDLQGALVVSRRICERVAKATLASGDEVLRPTISVGVASGSPRREYAFADLTRHAQASLDGAMAKGGNRVEFFDLVADAEAVVSEPV
ncbi:MAG: GGDEF domain-containing protein [Myxococcaceae bacterium]